jgi:class 3 adenylate cyclase
MERKIAVIFSADVQGYSLLMGDDEEATIRTLTAYRDVMTRLVEQHRGRIADAPGDNMLAEFASAVEAVQCAVAVQREIASRNTTLPPHRQMVFRIGINLGDVVVEEERLYGDGVNIAARLEGLAEGGGICISGTVYDQVETKVALGYTAMGEQTVKNITRPVRVYRVLIDAEAASARQQQAPTRAPHRRRQVGLTLVVAVLLVTGGATAMWYVSQRLPSSPRSIPPIQFALWDAVIAGDVEGVLTAIKAGADVNALDIRVQRAGPNGRRPLNYAAYRNDTVMIRALLRAGALIDATNLSGFTPLHHASEAGSTEAAALLIAQGASLTVKNHRLQTPLDTAEAFRHSATAAVIRRAMTQ